MKDSPAAFELAAFRTLGRGIRCRPFVRAIVMAAAGLLGSSGTPAAADDGWISKRVVARDAQFELKIEQRVIARPVFFIYRVEQAQRPLALARARRERSKRLGACGSCCPRRPGHRVLYGVH